MLEVLSDQLGDRLILLAGSIPERCKAENVLRHAEAMVRLRAWRG